MKKEVILYNKPDGEYPVEQFLESLPGKVSQKITWVIHLIEDLDRVPAQYFSKLTDSDDIWEFRIKLGSNIYRVFAFFDGNKVILTNGLVKKTQKTPPGDIKRAEEYKKEYLNRKRK
jgi:phage-related protein